MMKKLSITLLMVLFLGVQVFAYTGIDYSQPTSYTYNPRTTVTKTTTYTITSEDDYIKCDATSAAFTVTLPSISSLMAAGYGAKSYKIEKTDSTAYVVTVAPATGDTIGGESARKIVNQYGQIVIYSQGTNWAIAYETPYLNEDHEAGTTAFGGAQAYDAAVGITFDDGVTDSPALTWKDATDTTLAIVKVDNDFATFTTAAGTGVQITTGNLKVGNGTPTTAQDGEDCYVEGTFEFDMGTNLSGLIGDAVTDSLTIAASLQGAVPLILDGATDNAFDLSIGVLTDPTADVTVKIPSLTNGTLMLSTLTTNDVDVANSIWGISNGLAFGGATGADTFELQVKPMGDPAADKSILLPVTTNSAAIISALTTNDVDVANSIWGISNGLAMGGATGADGFELQLKPMGDPAADKSILFPVLTNASAIISSLTTNDVDVANSIWGVSNGLAFGGATGANGFETTLTAADVTADQTITFPNATGTVALRTGEVTTATDTLTAAECGKMIFLNSGTEYVTTLPALSTVAAGCEFEFIIKAAAAGANYTVVTGNALENKIFGVVDVNSAMVACADEDTITFVDGDAVGDWAKVRSDGTNWYITGSTLTAAKLTCTAAD